MGVDQLFAAGDLGQVQGGLGSGIQTADVGDHHSRVDALGGGQLQRLDHIGGIAAGGTHDMGRVVVHIVEVHLGAELLVGGACKEVQAAVTAQHGAGQLHHRRNGSVAEHIIKAGAAGQLPQLCSGVFHVGSVDEVQVDAVLLLDLLRGEEGLRTGQTILVDIGDHHHTGAHITVQCVGQSTQTHGTCTSQNGQLAALLDAHIVMVHTHLGVVSGVERTDGAAHGLGQRSLVVGASLVLQQAAQLHDLGRDDAVGGIAAEELVGVAGAPHGALVVQGGLQGELHAGLELVLMCLAHLDDITGELVTHDGGVLGYIRMHTLVSSAEDGALVSRHADAIGNDLDQDLIVLDLRQFKSIQTQIVGGVQTNSFDFHNETLLLL